MASAEAPRDINRIIQSMTKAQQSKQEQQKSQQHQKIDVVRWLYRVVGYDVFLVYGDTGTGKSTFAVWLAKEFARHGRKVLFIDTERNISEGIGGHENIWYQYVVDPNELKNMINNLPMTGKRNENPNTIYGGTYDLIVIDSIGFPVYMEFTESNMAERGRLLASAFRIAARLKLYAYSAKAVILLTNQPVSPFGKEAKDVFELDPFGGKARFATKEKWISMIEKRDERQTICGIYSNISRIFPPKMRLFTIRIRTKKMDELGVPVREVEVIPYWAKKT